MPVTAMIFDLDGTLADNFPVVMRAYRDTFTRHAGRTYSDEDIVALFGPNVEGIIRNAVPDNWQDAVETFYTLFDAYYTDHDAGVRGIDEVLGALSQASVRRAVVTGGSERSAEITLRHVGLSDCFEQIETGSFNGDRKPQAIAQVVSDFGVEPDQTVYVGDSPHDIQASREAGVVAIAAAWSRSAVHFLDRITQAGPDELFTDPRDLAAWIRNS